MAAKAFVGISALDLAPGQRACFGEDVFERAAVVWSAGQRLGVEDELAALAALVGGDERDLDAELVSLARFALADAFDLGRVPGVELGAALMLVLKGGCGQPSRAARRTPP